jgi:hypothetical protein
MFDEGGQYWFQRLLFSVTADWLFGVLLLREYDSLILQELHGGIHTIGARVVSIEGIKHRKEHERKCGMVFVDNGSLVSRKEVPSQSEHCYIIVEDGAVVSIQH